MARPVACHVAARNGRGRPIGESQGAISARLAQTPVTGAVSAAAETRLAAVAMFRSVYASLGVRCDDVS